MTAYFYNFNTKRSAHYDVECIDCLPEVESRPSAEDIENAVNRSGYYSYVTAVSEIRADDLPSVDYGYYAVFEIETHEFYPDDDIIKEDIEYKYVIAFQSEPDDDIIID